MASRRRPAAAAASDPTTDDAKSSYEIEKDPNDAKEKKLGPLFATVVVLGALLVIVDRAHSPLTREQKIISLLGISFNAVVIMFATSEKLPQALAYHNFADQRCLVCCVPNSLDVLSNIPFALVSAFGIDHVLEGTTTRTMGVPPAQFLNPDVERPLWCLYFIGVGLVSLGSGYYHWRPTNARLVYDRLPMTIAFMAILSNVIGETIGEAPPVLVITLVSLGVLSVFYWKVTDDLRPYALVQFYSLALLPLLMLLFPSRYTGALPDYMLALLFYVAAKVTEAKDKLIFKATGNRVSGHTIKHLLAGVATALASMMLVRRVPR
jgi:hypothetical protein